MPNQQLLDYVKQQVQMGVSPDMIKSTLISSGWSEVDIAEAMEGMGPSGMAASPATLRGAERARQKFEMPAGQGTTVSLRGESAKPVITTATIGGSRPRSSSKAPIIIMGIVILALIAGGGFLFMNNTSLKSELAASLGDKGKFTDQIIALTNEKNELSRQVDGLKQENNDINSQLMALVIPQGAPLNQEIPITMKGTLNGGDKVQYTLITSKGLTFYVKNYKTTKVQEALKPLLGTVVEVSGTHFPGSADITVTGVNGKTIE